MLAFIKQVEKIAKLANNRVINDPDELLYISLEFLRNSFGVYCQKIYLVLISYRQLIIQCFDEFVAVLYRSTNEAYQSIINIFQEAISNLTNKLEELLAIFPEASAKVNEEKISARAQDYQTIWLRPNTYLATSLTYIEQMSKTLNSIKEHFTVVNENAHSEINNMFDIINKVKNMAGFHTQLLTTIQHNEKEYKDIHMWIGKYLDDAEQKLQNQQRRMQDSNPTKFKFLKDLFGPSSPHIIKKQLDLTQKEDKAISGNNNNAGTANRKGL